MPREYERLRLGPGLREAPLDEMCDVLDAVKIDLKGFSPEFYRRVSRAELAPVDFLEAALRELREETGIEVEVQGVVGVAFIQAILVGICLWSIYRRHPRLSIAFTALLLIGYIFIIIWNLLILL